MNPRSSTTAPSREILLARARELVPVMRERAAGTEKARRVLPETHRDFVEAGFYKVLQPRRYGGYGLDYGVNSEIAMEIARGCPSSSWVSSITTCHAWLLGMMDERAQEHVWGDDDGQLIASCLVPAQHTAERVAGGYKVSGRWPFSSGVNVCQWVLVLLILPVKDGPPDRIFALMKLSDCAVEDTWFVTGLAGTGSNDVIARDLFVPDAHLLRVNDLNGGPTPGSAVNPEHIYQLPIFGVFSYNLVGTGVGAALGAVETLVDQLKTKSSARTGAQLAKLQSAQLRVAKAAAEADTARLIIERNIEEMNRVTREQNCPTQAQIMRYRRDASYASLLSVQAVDGLYPLIGGQGLASDNAVNRFWRDAHAVHQHIALTWDNHGTAYGEWRLGVTPATPR